MARNPKDKARSILRRLAAEERERVALEGYVEGLRYVDIAEKIHVSPKSIPGIIKRGLERRAAEEGPTVAAARWLYGERLGRLIAAWWPIALGLGQVDEDDPTTQRTPDLRAAELVLKLITQAAQIEGALTPAPPSNGGDINLFAVLPDNPDSARQQILTVLAAIRAKEAAVDAELAGAGTSHAELTAGVDDDDAPPPPVIIEGGVIDA